MAEQSFTPCLLAFAGERVGPQNKRYVAYCLVDAEGAKLLEGIDEEKWFEWKASRAKLSVGSVYKGASISDDGKTISNLDRVQWARLFPDPGTRWRWTSLQGKAQAANELARMEKEAKFNELEAMLLPLRVEYAALLKRYNMAGAAALEAAVVRALHTPPRKTEE